MLRLLKAEGFAASAWPSAEAFLADSHRPPFDCLLLDVQMDGMSGIDLLRVLQDAGTAPPAVFVTALAAPEYREQAERAGCAAYLRKNDPGSSVIAAIRQAAGNRGARTPGAPPTFP